MRVHIDIDKDLVARVDTVAGKRHRTQFVRDAVLAALEQRDRLESIHAARGAIPDRGHEWDADPGEWVRAQRQGDVRRVG